MHEKREREFYMKNIISVLLSSLIVYITAFAGILSVSASTDDTDEKHYSIISSKTITIPDNQVRVFTSNLTKDNCYGNVLLNNTKVAISDCIDTCETINTENGKEYKIGINFGAFSSITSDKYSYDKTGGTYEWVKFKIYDFANSGFNENGTVTRQKDDDIHDYNFTSEDDCYKSALLIISGAEITVAAPYKNGYVEAYISTNLGDKTEYMTEFLYRKDGISTFGGGSRYRLYGLPMGDTNQNGYVNIYDAGLIQKYIAGLEEFDSLSEHNADVNHDGRISVEDVTTIQKYLAGLEY